MRRQSVKHGVCKNDGDGELEELKENPGGKVSSLNLQKSGHRREIMKMKARALNSLMNTRSPFLRAYASAAKQAIAAVTYLV